MALADDISSLERKIVQLKTDYEQYFSGVQKIEPAKLRTDVERTIQTLSNQRITNTAISFRLNTVVAKFHSYRAYWDRVVREIEEGRYVREVFRMKLHDRMKVSAPAGAASAPFPASEDDKIKRIYQEYVEARKKTNEPPVKYETVSDLINKQIPVIREKYKASSVDFRVVIEDGKAKLKAVPKK